MVSEADDKLALSATQASQPGKDSPSDTTTDPVLATGTVLGPYRIESLLGQGAMGQVYRGVHVALGRRVAIKTLKPRVAGDGALLERFFAEARAVNIINHENIVECTDLVREPGGRSYLVMELLEGRTLSELITQVGKLPAARAVAIASQIADALAAAHSHQIVHRDLKPDNVFLIRRANTDDYVKVLDFGIARLRPDMSANATQDGMVIGTPAYMSPEQVAGAKVTPSADIYALGVLMFQMLTGRLPFTGSSAHMVLIAHVNETAPPVTAFAPDVPPAVAGVVARLLAKDPAERPPDMATARAELRASLGGERAASIADTIASAQLRAPTPPPLARTRRRVLPFVLVAAAAAAVAVAAVVWWNRGTARTARPTSYSARQVLEPSHELESVAISPDGATLALAREGRLTFMDLAHPERSWDLDPPLERVPKFMYWYPDGEQLLIGAADDTPSTLVVVDMHTRKLAPYKPTVHAWSALPAHDGKRIVVLDAGGIHVMHDGVMTDVVSARSDEEIAAPVWSPDDRWIAYESTGRDHEPYIQVVAVDGHTSDQLVSDPTLRPTAGWATYDWLADGRLVYTLHPRDGSTHVMALDVDVSGEHPRRRGEPHELIALPDDVSLKNETADGRLLISRDHWVRAWYRISVAGGAAQPVEAPTEIVALAADGSKPAVSMTSTNGTTELVASEGGRSRVIARVHGLLISACVVPGGGAVLAVHDDGKSLSLARIAMTGEVTETRLLYPRGVGPEWTRENVAAVSCPRTGSRPCVLGAHESQGHVYRPIDPKTLALGEPVATVPNTGPFEWQLSPDGARLAIAREADPVRVIDLVSHKETTVLHDGFYVSQIGWIDDASLVVAGGSNYVIRVFRTDLSGTTTPLWATDEVPLRLVSAPDGQTIYLQTFSRIQSIWLLEPRRD